MPGQVGLFQATEAIKLILKKGKPLIGQFLIYHSLEADLKSFMIKKNPECSLCGEEPRIKELVGYHDACPLETAVASAP